MAIPQRVEHHYRVRFDEAGADGYVRPSSLLRYAQDVAWRHSEEAGFDRAWYDGRSLHWLVRNGALEIMASATYGDVLAISTEIVGWRQVWARRHTEVRHGDVLVAVVRTDWVLLDDRGRAARVPREILRHFSEGQSFERARVALPQPPSKIASRRTLVRSADIDPLGHMNNAAYIDVIDDAVGQLADVPRRHPRHILIGYVRPALAGASITLECWLSDETTAACRIIDDDGSEVARALLSWQERSDGDVATACGGP